METSPSSQYANERYGEEWVRRHKQPSCNKVTMLMERERGRFRRGALHYISYKSLMTTVKIDRSVQIREEERTQDWFLAWTPDGQKMIAMKWSQKGIVIYNYLGVERGRDKPANYIVSSLFEEAHDIDFTAESGDMQTGPIRPEHVLFTPDSNYLVMITALQLNEAIVPLYLSFRNNESLPFASNIDTYCLFSIDIKKGVIADRLWLPAGKITGNGVSMVERMISILCIHQQNIHIIAIHPTTGQFQKVKEIGPSIHEDDSMYLHEDVTKTWMMTHFMSGLKQRISTFLYKRAKKEGKVMQYLRAAKYREDIRVEKQQFIDTKFLLLRMQPRQAEDANRYDFFQIPCFYVLLDWRTVEILDIFEKFDERFLDWYEAMSAYIYQNQSHSKPGAHMMDPLNNPNALKSYTYSKMRPTGNRLEFCRRMLNTLPISTNPACTLSPYLDMRYFSIDEKLMTSLFVGRIKTENGALRVYSRRYGHHLFSLTLAPSAKVVFILFHPTDPLVITVDRTHMDSPTTIFLPHNTTISP